jgi:hypothetical protein
MKSTSMYVDEYRPLFVRTIYGIERNDIIMLKDWTSDEAIYFKRKGDDVLNEVAMYLNSIGISVDGYSRLKNNEMLIFTKNFDIKLQMDNFGV